MLPPQRTQRARSAHVYAAQIVQANYQAPLLPGHFREAPHRGGDRDEGGARRDPTVHARELRGRLRGVQNLRGQERRLAEFQVEGLQKSQAAQPHEAHGRRCRDPQVHRHEGGIGPRKFQTPPPDGQDLQGTLGHGRARTRHRLGDRRGHGVRIPPFGGESRPDHRTGRSARYVQPPSRRREGSGDRGGVYPPQLPRPSAQHVGPDGGIGTPRHAGAVHLP
mmetsp:Transcript_7917/g.23439  ORF Transcript_7917/g.23439 Transcript_7917/m.23439 type:complete len:221 (-) Transcript_7917:1348-2010(-)